MSEHPVTLTRDEITAGATYTVRLDGPRLSGKRFRDAVALVKGLNDRPETAATYDPAARAWTVTLPAGSVGGLYDLQVACGNYGATVKTISESEISHGQA